MPLPHATHEAAPACEKVPPTHAEQFHEPAAEKVPPAQLSQLEAPPSERLPASQSVQEDEALPLYLPAAHVEQVVEFFADHFPPSQEVQVVDAFGLPVKNPAKHSRHSSSCADGAYRPLGHISQLSSLYTYWPAELGRVVVVGRGSRKKANRLTRSVQYSPITARCALGIRQLACQTVIAPRHP